MYHFYAEERPEVDGIIRIDGSDYNHIKNVLRMKTGEESVICDGKGTEYVCELSSYEEKTACFKVNETRESVNELPAEIVLFQGLPKKDKMELIIEKAVELGVRMIVPVMTKRVVVKIEDSVKEEKKLSRWNAIAKSAAMQSGRGYMPSVAPIMNFKDAIDLSVKLGSTLIPYEESQKRGVTVKKSREIFESLKGVRNLGIFIGPEGGFEESEVEYAIDKGAKCVSLGKRILRTETAGLCALSLVMFNLEEQE